MAIKVEFKSALKNVTGTQAVTIDRKFDTFEKALMELIRLYPELKEEMFYADGTIDYIIRLS